MQDRDGGTNQNNIKVICKNGNQKIISPMLFLKCLLICTVYSMNYPCYVRSHSNIMQVRHAYWVDTLCLQFKQRCNFTAIAIGV
jgi:hypothetical protein